MAHSQDETTGIPPHLTCPCCGERRNTRRDTPLLALEQGLRERGADPWQRPPSWSVVAAQAGQLQWACAYCIEQGRARPARPWAQTFCDFPPYFAYYDRTLPCTDCRLPFLFSASEQEYWYEQLRFWVQSHPKQCLACRRKRRRDTQTHAQLQAALDQLDTSNADQFLQIAELYLQLASPTKARTYFGRARKRAGNDEQKSAIEARIAAL